MEIVKTNGLSKTYKNALVLNNVSITIEKGDIYGLIGKNGAGKTTLMRIICGLTLPSGGTFSLFGKTSEADLVSQRSKLGAIIETPSLYSNFSARKNLQTVAIIKGIDLKSPKIDEMLEFSGLSDTGSKKVKNFSLGMKQRLAIAMALLNEPEFLILDEPVNGLDPVGIVEMREILKRINREKGTTILISSHILTELSQLATKFGIIDRGNLIEETTAEKLEEKMSKTLNISFSNIFDIERAVELLKTKFNVKDYQVQGDTIVIKDKNAINNGANINMELSKENIFVRSVNINTIDLEQYFINLTRGGSL